MRTKEERIGSQDLFGGCRSADVAWIAHVADEIAVPAGTSLVTEGAVVREFIMILDGVAAEGVVLRPGAHIGEMGLIDGGKHDHSVTAMTDMTLLVFDARAFSGLLERVPVVARKLMREFVAQLRGTGHAADVVRVA